MKHQSTIKHILQEGLNIPKALTIRDFGRYYLIDPQMIEQKLNGKTADFPSKIEYQGLNDKNNKSLVFGLFVDRSIDQDEIHDYFQDLNIFPEFGCTITLEYHDTYDEVHLYSLYLFFNKEVIDDISDTPTTISEYKQPLLKILSENKNIIKDELITKHDLSPTILNPIFSLDVKEITETLLNILDVNTIKKLINEISFKCSINDVEKKAKKIIFVKYNWDPKNVVFSTENGVVQIIAVDDLKPELQNTQNDEVLFKFLNTLSVNYTKDLNNEFVGFCSNFKLLSKLVSDISSSVYCYTIIQQNGSYYFLSSNGEKKKIKKVNHPQYLLNKLYFKIGLFANNLSEGLNLKKITTPEEWFRNLLNSMDEKYKPEYPNKTYYTIRGENYMIYNSESKYLWYDYDKIYSVLKEKYGLNHDQMNELIKGLVEQHYNLRGITPMPWLFYQQLLVEQHYNLRGITPLTNLYVQFV